MRTIIGGAIVLALLSASACEQRTETQTVTGTNGTVEQKTTTVTATMPQVDTAATAQAKSDAQRAGEKVETAARDAAHATGTALEKAGKEIERRTRTRKP
jgi:hypothetical protein